MSYFVVTHRSRPYLVLFQSPDLEEAVEALNAQPDADELVIHHSQDGFARELDGAERDRLARAVRRPGV